MTAGLPAACFTSPTLHEAEIELADGSVHRFQFREFTAGEYLAVQRLARSEDAAERDSHQALVVSLSLCGDDGARALTHEQALQLHPSVHARMYVAALEANGFGAKREDDAGNASPPGVPTGSGTS